MGFNHCGTIYLPDNSSDSGPVEWNLLTTRFHSIYINFLLSRAFVPAVLLGEAEPKIEQSAKTQEQPIVRKLYPEC